MIFVFFFFTINIGDKSYAWTERLAENRDKTTTTVFCQVHRRVDKAKQQQQEQRAGADLTRFDSRSVFVLLVNNYTVRAPYKTVNDVNKTLRKMMMMMIIITVIVIIIMPLFNPALAVQRDLRLRDNNNIYLRSKI